MKDKYQSVGEYLYKEFYQKLRLESEKKGNNITKEFKNVRNKKESYEHCVAQEQVRAELELIFAKQKEFGITFSENFESQIIETAFYQKDLKSFENKVGKCVFYDEPRAPKDSLSAIEFVALTRIINTLKNLEEKAKILALAKRMEKIRFKRF